MDRTDCCMGGRCPCGSVELAWLRIVSLILLQRRVDEVRVRANYGIGIRR